MSYIQFDGLKKPTAIAKSLKKLLATKTLTEAKNLVAELSGYSDWTHLKREVEKPDTNESYINGEQVKSITQRLLAYPNHEIPEKDLSAFIAINFSFVPKDATELHYFLNSKEAKDLEIHKEIHEEFEETLPAELKGNKSNQVILDMKMETIQNAWNDKHHMTKCAMYYFLATEMDSTRAQTHLGKVLGRGCTGFKDLKTSVEMLKSGLPYTSEAIFSDKAISLNKDCSIEEMQLGTLNSFLLLCENILNLNNHLDDNYYKDLHDVCDKGIELAGKVYHRPEARHATCHFHYKKAVAYAMEYYSDPSVKPTVASEAFKQLDKAASGDNPHEYSKGLIEKYVVLNEALKYEIYKYAPVSEDVEIIELTLAEISGAFVPAAREAMCGLFLSAYAKGLDYLQEYDNAMEPPLTLAQRVKEDSIEWPHLKDAFYGVANNLLTEYYKNGLMVDQAIEVGKYLFDGMHAQLNANTVMAIVQHHGRKVCYDYFKDKISLLFSDNYTIKSEVMDMALSRFIEAHILTATIPTTLDFDSCLAVCDKLQSNYYMHPTFQLIYFVRENLLAFKLDWVLEYAEKAVALIESPDFKRHKYDMEDSVDKIFMEHGVLQCLYGDYDTGIKYLKIAGENYPDALRALHTMAPEETL